MNLAPEEVAPGSVDEDVLHAFATRDVDLADDHDGDVFAVVLDGVVGMKASARVGRGSRSGIERVHDVVCSSFLCVGSVEVGEGRRLVTVTAAAEPEISLVVLWGAVVLPFIAGTGSSVHGWGHSVVNEGKPIRVERVKRALDGRGAQAADRYGDRRLRRLVLGGDGLRFAARLGVTVGVGVPEGTTAAEEVDARLAAKMGSRMLRSIFKASPLGACCPCSQSWSVLSGISHAAAACDWLRPSLTRASFICVESSTASGIIHADQVSWFKRWFLVHPAGRC